MTIKTLTPAFVPAPGEIIIDELEARGWTQADLAKIIDRPVQAISEIVNAKKEITPDTALRLAQAFGTSPDLWLGLETAYQLFKARQRQDPGQAVARRSRLFELVPVREMTKRGWIDDSDNVDELEAAVRGFLEIPKLDQMPRWAGAWFRASEAFAPELSAQLAWVARVRHLARQQRPATFRPERIEALLQLLLAGIEDPEFVTQVPELLAAHGVHFVIVPAFPKTGVDGAAFKLERHPVIALSLRFGQLDRFWFTLLHELAHIALGHADVFVDDIYRDDSRHALEVHEREANDWAGDHLVPAKAFQAFLKANTAPFFSRAAVETFAAEIGRHPSVIVGRLHHDDLMPWKNLRALQPNVKPLLEPWSDRGVL